MFQNPVGVDTLYACYLLETIYYKYKYLFVITLKIKNMTSKYSDRVILIWSIKVTKFSVGIWVFGLLSFYKAEI